MHTLIVCEKTDEISDVVLMNRGGYVVYHVPRSMILITNGEL
jgi:hypothetical protein